jgi:hypothetical protein
MFVPPGVRVRPVAILIAAAIMVLALVYSAVNRSYPVIPYMAPLHQLR